MNERILELAKQAGLKFSSETAMSPVEQKFALLIVREAIGVCQVDVDALTSPFLPEYEKGIVEGYRRANENLRFLFGVEE